MKLNTLISFYCNWLKKIIAAKKLADTISSKFYPSENKQKKSPQINDFLDIHGVLTKKAI